MWVDFSGYLGGVFLMLSFFPQVIKSAQTRQTNDISWGMLLCTLFSGIFYEMYAFILKLTPVVIMNGVFVVMVIIQICLKWKFDISADRKDNKG